MRLRIYLEETADGSWVGHGSAGELGCTWTGTTRPEVLERAPAALRAYLEWLRHHGEPQVHVPDTMAVEVAEALKVTEPGAAATFAWDADPATGEDLAAAIRRLDYARVDMLTAIYGLPAAALQWAPAGGPSLQRLLDGVADLYGYCFSRLGLEWSPPPPGELGAAMAAATRALHAMPYDLRGGAVWVPEPPELWTARKVLRILAEREYAAARAVAAAAARWRAGRP